MGYRIIKKKCENPKFEVVMCCQGQPMVYQYDKLYKALFGYAKLYKDYAHYGTMNFTLKEC